MECTFLEWSHPCHVVGNFPLATPFINNEDGAMLCQSSNFNRICHDMRFPGRILILQIVNGGNGKADRVNWRKDNEWSPLLMCLPTTIRPNSHLLTQRAMNPFLCSVLGQELSISTFPIRMQIITTNRGIPTVATIMGAKIGMGVR